MFSHFFGKSKESKERPVETINTVQEKNNELVKENENLKKEVELLKKEAKMYQNLMFSVKMY